MAPVQLAPAERQSLLQILDTTHDVREFRRAQSLLWLDEGLSVLKAADQQHVSRQAVYLWIQRFKNHPKQPVLERVADAPRSGRPAKIKGIIDPILDATLQQDPRTFGYSQANWTADLWVRFLKEHHALPCSPDSVRQALHRLRIVWKAPRYRLRRRPLTWRQKKGAENRLVYQAQNGPLDVG